MRQASLVPMHSTPAWPRREDIPPAGRVRTNRRLDPKSKRLARQRYQLRIVISGIHASLSRVGPVGVTSA